MKTPLCILVLLAMFLSACTTQNLQQRLDRNVASISGFQSNSATVTLAYPSKKYERFRSRLEAEIKSRYVTAENTAKYPTFELIIDEVHFSHKAASFVTGGASGGNWLRGRFILPLKDSSREFPIYKTFNTGGGYTILQDWEVRMISSILVEIDSILINTNR